MWEQREVSLHTHIQQTYGQGVVHRRAAHGEGSGQRGGAGMGEVGHFDKGDAKIWGHN